MSLDSIAEVPDWQVANYMTLYLLTSFFLPPHDNGWSYSNVQKQQKLWSIALTTYYSYNAPIFFSVFSIVPKQVLTATHRNYVTRSFPDSTFGQHLEVCGALI